MLKKILLGLSTILAIAAIAFYFFINTGIDLPKETDNIVNEVLSSAVPELVTGKTGFANNGEVSIWYEAKQPTDSVKGNVLLVMGLGASAMVWSNDFCQPLLDAGYQVIRYDNRDAGLSTWLEDWEENHPYTLEDMAKDGIAVLDDLGINKAHIIGASMGGMIAQRMAISHADRVASLTSIMSSGYVLDPAMPTASDEMNQKYLKLGMKYLLNRSEANILKFHVGVQQQLKGNGGYTNNVKNSAHTTLYELRKRKGYNRRTVEQQMKAIEVSGSRLEELGQIQVPTLIIHGKSDPLVLFEHAQKYAPLIPNAETLFIEGMGHDLPSIYWEQIHNGILKTIGRTKLVEQIAETVSIQE